MGKPGTQKQSGQQTQAKIDQYAVVERTPVDGAAGGTSLPEGDISTILQAISASQISVEHKIGEVRVDMALIRQDLRNVAARITEAESRLSTAEDDLAQPKTQVTRLLTQTTELHRWAEDAENRLRGNNLRLVGFPEEVERGQADVFPGCRVTHCRHGSQLSELTALLRPSPQLGWPLCPLLCDFLTSGTGMQSFGKPALMAP